MAYPQVPHATYDEFRNAVNGQYYDLDGQYGAQCYDGALLLYVQNDINQFLYTAHNVDPSLAGTAKSCWSYEPARNLNASGHFSPVYDKTQIKKGDILVFDTRAGWYGASGHIGYADEDYNGTDYLNILSENYGAGSNPTTGKAFNIARAYLSPFLGAFRYDGWQSPIPPQPTATKKRKKFPWVTAWNFWGY